MFTSRKRIFAGKGNLKSLPFCPFLSDAAGLSSLSKQMHSPKDGPGETFSPRSAYRDGKRYA